MNRLQYEKSPYLLQHKNNPVEWHPWGKEAFDQAMTEDKPVFLSIGYSTCHWCHVMAHESFEDEEVADFLNRNFICIKVDREERPDVDAVYMGVCQMMTGAGGWPLTIMMTPDQKPFFAGTYFPKFSRYGMPGLMELLAQIERLWNKERKKLLETSEKITDFLQQEQKLNFREPNLELLEKGAAELLQRFDREWGGFGVAPKFPTPHNLLFLMRYGKSEGNEIIITVAEKTLESMAQGGMFDQIGGGFSRYSTDEKWLIPHFEKMLYDNALLAYTYLEGYRQTGNPFYKEIAERTLDYVLCELTDKDGGFYCGQDADSEGEEGKYYVFKPEEIKRVLEQDAEEFCRYYHIETNGNFGGASVPNRLKEIAEIRPKGIKAHCEKVYEYRKKRVTLHKDDKILTAWNGLMIAAFAKAGFLCSNETYINMAKRAVDFLEQNLMDEKERLYLRYRDGEAAHMGQLDDYAFYAFGLLELYTATFNINYLEKAIHLAEQIKRWFADENGGLYLYAEDAEQLIQRPKETYDGAMPSGNAVAGYVFSRLAALTGDVKWLKEREKQFAFLSGTAQEMPSAHCFALYGMGDVVYPSIELVCVSTGKNPSAEFMDFLREQKEFGMTVLFKNVENAENLQSISPFTRDYPIPEKGEQYYLCKGTTCFEPQNCVAGLKQIMGV